MSDKDVSLRLYRDYSVTIDLEPTVQPSPYGTRTPGA